MTVNQKMYILKKSHFVKKPVFSHWKVNFSDYLLPLKAQPIKPFSKDTNERPALPLSSPSFQLVKKPSKPLLRAVASASMWKNICRSYLLPCCCFNFILAGLDHFISRHCKHLWLKAKGEFWSCPQNFLHFTVSWSSLTSLQLLPCFSPLYF